MNTLQQKELDLLKIFLEICVRLELRYFLVCGSALGAVKYNGFIPWDDDLDVGLYREDYNRFLKEAPKFLPKGVFLQTYDTDPYYPNIFAKLRDSETTYIEKAVTEIPMNHGIYIDIFPLDGYPLDVAEQRKLEKKKRRYKHVISCAYQVDRSIKGRIAVQLMRFVGIHKNTQKYLRKYERLISAYPIKNSLLVCNHGNWQGKREYAPKEQYGQGEILTFEGLQVRVPEKYDEYLTQKYGDWRAELPKEKQIGHHTYAACDPLVSYRNYIKQKRNKK